LNRIGGRTGHQARRERIGEQAPIVFLLTAGAVSIAIAVVAGVLASRTVGTNDAIEEVRVAGKWIAHTVGEPNLSDELIAGDRGALEDFDQIVRDQVLSNSPVRVKLWSADGRVIYSDEPALIGRTFGLKSEELEALRSGETLAAIAEIADPANESETDLGPLLQVYVPVQAPGGEELLFEMYFPYDLVTAHSSKTWLALIPIIFGSVFVVGIIHVPLAMNMSTRLRRHQEQREGLLQRAIEAANLERRRVAADLHDGVVQDLATISFRLAALENLIEKGDHPEILDGVHRSADSIRAVIASLRALMVDIYPPNLREEGLESALAKLLDPAKEAGLATSLEIKGSPRLTPELELLTYRMVRESIHNTLKHAGARNLRVTISNTTHPLEVEITDDGAGFSAVDDARDGHLGLKLLSDLARDLAADVEVSSIPGRGTSVRLEVQP
jgi:signal transduction histidine kinase